MTTLIIGGTFNPVHIGHLYLAEEAMRSLGYQRVLFIPSHIPAHKEHDPHISPQQRLEMLRLVLSDSPFSVDDTEIRRGGVSYTIDTVRDLQNRYHIQGRPGLIVGDDLVDGLPEWKEWETLRTMVDLVIAHRTTTERVPCRWEHRYLDNLILPVASSDLRERIAEGGAFRFLLPPEAYRYIREYGLYGCKENAE
jgi:nicotinate-nucleotide adenylyltransferase